MLQRMNDDQLLRYSRHILLDELGIEGQRRLLAAHALVIGAGGLGSPVALYLGTAGVGRSRSSTTTRSTSPTCSARSRTTCRASASRRPNRRARSIAGHQPRRAGRGRGCSAPMPRCWTSWCRDADVVLDCSDNFAHPPGRQRRLRRAPQAAGVGRGDRLRRPDLGLRHAPAPTRPAMPASSRPRPRSRRRTARRWACSRRWSASSAAMQAAEALKLLAGIGTLAGRPAADARRAHDGVDADRGAAQRRLRGVRGAARRMLPSTPAATGGGVASDTRAR